MAENIEKTRVTDQQQQENEDARKLGEARSNTAEEALEEMEVQLEEANSVANQANIKYEDANRKLKVVEGDLERIVERAEEFEAKTRETETQVRDVESRVKETEAVTLKNADEEDKFEQKISKLQEEFKNADIRYEVFALVRVRHFPKI